MPMSTSVVLRFVFVLVAPLCCVAWTRSISCQCFPPSSECQVDCGCGICPRAHLKAMLAVDIARLTPELDRKEHALALDCIDNLRKYINNLRTPPRTALTTCGTCFTDTATCDYHNCPSCAECDASSMCRVVQFDLRTCVANRTDRPKAEQIVHEMLSFCSGVAVVGTGLEFWCILTTVFTALAFRI